MKFSVITCTYNQLPLLKKAKEYWDKQTFLPFEWIIADDGSTDGTKEWAKKNGIKVVSHKENKGYRLDQIINKAAKVAKCEYLVWVMGDSYPKEDFLEKLAELVKPDRLVNGVRINVDKDGAMVSMDWRISGIEPGVKKVKVDWMNMTLNSMCVPRKMYNKLGGMFEGYEGYGRGDWDFIARANFVAGAEMWIAPEAIVYHINHGDRKENPKNVKIFEERLKGFKNEANTRI